VGQNFDLKVHGNSQMLTHGSCTIKGKPVNIN
jgi:hypothetical protein